MLYTLNAKQKNYVNFFEILSFGVILHCLAALYTTNSSTVSVVYNISEILNIYI